MSAPQAPSSSSTAKNNRPAKPRHAWSAATAPELKALGAPTDAAAWTAWQATLADRAKKAKASSSLDLAVALPSAWRTALDTFNSQLRTQSADELSVQMAALIEAATQPAIDWTAAEPPAALKLLAWSRSLPALAARLTGAEWLAQIEQLAALADEAGSISGDEWQTLALTWLAGELPLALSESVPELDSLRRLGLAGKREVERQLDDWLDGAGFPSARALPWAIPLLASWTRCRAILDAETRVAPWRDDAERQFVDFAKVCLSLRRGDGEPALAPYVAAYNIDDLFAFLSQKQGDRDPALTASLVQAVKSAPGWRSMLLPVPAVPPKPAVPASNSEWAEGAIMRSAWHRSALLLAARFNEHGGVDLDLSSDRIAWLAGRWTFDAKYNDAPLVAHGGWDVVCWQDDEESLYLELEQEVRGGGVEGRLQRQLLVAKKDRFALGLDVLFDLPEGKIEYVSSLPVALGTTASIGDRSVEVYLRNGTSTARWLPLPLPEWKRESPNRDWPRVLDDRITFSLSDVGRALCYGWLIDLDVKRAAGDEITWRRLTIAEERRTLKRDEAFGARVQIGKKFNWLIYRTLGKAENRTVLGKNLTSDFFCGRFLKTGLTEAISEIET